MIQQQRCNNGVCGGEAEIGKQVRKREREKEREIDREQYRGTETRQRDR